MRDDIPILSIATVLGLAIAVLGLAMAIFSQQLIDVILPGKEIGKLTLGVVAVGLLLLARALLQKVRGFLLIRQSKEFNNRIVGVFFEKLIALSMQFFDTRRIGDLVARLNDTVRIQRVITMLLGNAVIEVLIIVASLVLVFIYSWQTGVLVLFCIPMIAFIIMRFNDPIIISQRETMVGYATTESFFINSMGSISAIKQLTLEGLFRDMNKKLYDQYQQKQFRLGEINITLSFIIGIVSSIFLIVLLVFTSMQVINDHIQLGELAAILGISSTLFASTVNVGLLSVPFNEAKVAFHRMYEYVSMEQEPNGKTVINEVMSIAFKHVAFRYLGGKLVLDKANAEFAKGEVVLVSGENGSGKSTLSLLIQKFYIPESGSILVNGSIDLNLLDNQAWRSKIGVVDQEVTIFDGTLASNLIYAKSDAEITVVEGFLKESGLDNFFNKLPNGYATRLGEEGVNLSGGQKKLIGIARAFLRRPEILILDEPENNLDKESLRLLIQLINQYKRHKIVLIISHGQEFSKLADKKYIIQNGDIMLDKGFLY